MRISDWSSDRVLFRSILRLRSAIITRVKIASAGLIGKTKLGRFLRVLKRPESRIQESTSFHPFVGNLHPSLTPFFRREGSIAGSTQGSIRRWESTERQPTTLERRLPLSQKSAELRAGKECVSPFRSRWSPNHKKKTYRYRNIINIIRNQ